MEISLPHVTPTLFRDIGIGPESFWEGLKQSERSKDPNAAMHARILTYDIVSSLRFPWIISLEDILRSLTMIEEKATACDYSLPDIFSITFDGLDLDDYILELGKANNLDEPGRSERIAALVAAQDFISCFPFVNNSPISGIPLINENAVWWTYHEVIPLIKRKIQDQKVILSGA